MRVRRCVRLTPGIHSKSMKVGGHGNQSVHWECDLRMDGLVLAGNTIHIDGIQIKGFVENDLESGDLAQEE